MTGAGAAAEPLGVCMQRGQVQLEVSFQCMLLSLGFPKTLLKWLHPLGLTTRSGRGPGTRMSPV